MIEWRSETEKKLVEESWAKEAERARKAFDRHEQIVHTSKILGAFVLIAVLLFGFLAWHDYTQRKVQSCTKTCLEKNFGQNDCDWICRKWR